jgi:hypothetical protein
MATLSWKVSTLLWLAGSIQITVLIEHFERNNHANLAEIPRHERFYAETLLCFIFSLRGAAIMLGFSTLRGSYAESPHQFTNCVCITSTRAKWMLSKLALVITRRDLQTAQHEEYWLLVARRCAGFSKPAHLYSGASQPAGSGEELGCFPSRSGMAEGKGGIGGERETGGSWRRLRSPRDHIDHYFMDPTSFSALK